MFTTQAQDNSASPHAAEIDDLNETIRTAELRKRELLEGPKAMEAFDEAFKNIFDFTDAFEMAHNKFPKDEEVKVFDVDAFNQMLNELIPNKIAMDPSHYQLFCDPGEPENTLPLPKLMVMGYGRHGKDTVCEMLEDEYGFKFISSSRFCADKVLFPLSQQPSTTLVQPRLYLPYYSDVESCYEDRHNHRKTWFDAITDYNTPDLGRLGRELYADYDIYCGIRNAREFHALKNTGSFDVSIWVDRSEHMEPEGVESCSVQPWMADYVLDNNSDLYALRDRIAELMESSVL